MYRIVFVEGNAVKRGTPRFFTLQGFFRRDRVVAGLYGALALTSSHAESGAGSLRMPMVCRAFTRRPVGRTGVVFELVCRVEECCLLLLLPARSGQGSEGEEGGVYGGDMGGRRGGYGGGPAGRGPTAR